MSDDFDSLEEQLRKFPPRPLSPALERRVLEAAARPATGRWKIAAALISAAAAVAFAMLFLFQNLTTNSVANKSKMDAVTKPSATEEVPAYDGKDLLNQYYRRVAAMPPIQVPVKPKPIVRSDRRDSDHGVIVTAAMLRPLIEKELKIISEVRGILKPLNLDNARILNFNSRLQEWRETLILLLTTSTEDNVPDHRV